MTITKISEKLHELKHLLKQEQEKDLKALEKHLDSENEFDFSKMRDMRTQEYEITIKFKV